MDARFTLELKWQAVTMIEQFAVGSLLRHVEGRELLRPDITSLADFALALHEAALTDFKAKYGPDATSEAIRLLVIAYQQQGGRIVLQPDNPLAVITLKI